MKKIFIVEVPDGYEVYKVQLQGVKMSSKDMLAVYDFTEFIPPTEEEIMDIAIINSNSVDESTCFMNGEKHILSLLK